MASIQFNRFSFTYPSASKKALTDITLEVAEGEFVLVCGPSGSGKTTFLQQLKQEIKPVGEQEGEILFNGKAIESLSAREAVEIGFVFQDPDNQLVHHSVEQELAFALENLGYSAHEMRKRIGEMVHFFGMQDWLHQPVEELSGGQKQMINLASVLLLRPKLLLLDEPTAQLDPVAAKEFLLLVGRINQEFSTTIIINEHRLEELFPLATKVLLMAEGKLVYQGSPHVVCQQVWAADDQEWLPYLPSISRLYLMKQAERGQPLPLEGSASIPLTVREGRQWLSKELSSSEHLPQQKNESPRANKLRIRDAILSCRGVSFQYARGERKILHQLDAEVEQGDIYAILGGNGAGKSTLLKIMLGLLKPQQGNVFYQQHSLFKLKEQERFRYMGYVDQNPRLYFIHDTLEKCLKQRAEQLGLVEPYVAIKQLMDELGLAPTCLTQHPYDLSGGEQQKAALAMVLLAKPTILFLDEPTKGLDPQTKLRLGELLLRWREEQVTVVLVSHDLEFVAEYASRCALLFDGQLSEASSPEEFFSHNYFYTTVIQRLFRETWPQAITLGDVIKRWK